MNDTKVHGFNFYEGGPMFMAVSDHARIVAENEKIIGVAEIQAKAYRRMLEQAESDIKNLHDLLAKYQRLHAADVGLREIVEIVAYPGNYEGRPNAEELMIRARALLEDLK